MPQMPQVTEGPLMPLINGLSKEIASDRGLAN